MLTNDQERLPVAATNRARSSPSGRSGTAEVRAQECGADGGSEGGDPLPPHPALREFRPSPRSTTSRWDRRGRVRVLPGAVGLRQDDAAARDRRPSTSRRPDASSRTGVTSPPCPHHATSASCSSPTPSSQPDRRQERRLRLENARASVRSRPAVRELLDMVGLGEQGGKYPAQLSGGSNSGWPSPAPWPPRRPPAARRAAVGPRRQGARAPAPRGQALQRRLGVTTIMVTHVRRRRSRWPTASW